VTWVGSAEVLVWRLQPDDAIRLSIFPCPLPTIADMLRWVPSAKRSLPVLPALILFLRPNLGFL
jgi:hypothetical protein